MPPRPRHNSDNVSGPQDIADASPPFLIVTLVRARRDTITSGASSVGPSVLAKVRSNSRSAPKVPPKNEESRRSSVNKIVFTWLPILQYWVGRSTHFQRCRISRTCKCSCIGLATQQAGCRCSLKQFSCTVNYSGVYSLHRVGRRGHSIGCHRGPIEWEVRPPNPSMVGLSRIL